MDHQKSLGILLITALLLFACDESGDFPDAHIGLWKLTNSFYVYNSDTTTYAISGVNTLEIKEDQSFVQVSEGWEILGTWRFNHEKLTLRYDTGGYDVYYLDVDGDWMSLIHRYDYYGNVVQYVYEYVREGSS